MRVFVHSRICVNVRVRIGLGEIQGVPVSLLPIYLPPPFYSAEDADPPPPPAPLQSGGFYSAEDTDSFAVEGADQKKEGAFCVWTQDEIARFHEVCVYV